MQNSPSSPGCCSCQTPEGGENRRGFLGQAIALVCGGAALLIPAATGIAAFLNPLRQKSQSGQFLRVASLDALPADGTPQKMPVIAERSDAWNRFPAGPVGAVFLCRKGDEVTAMQAMCPHEGCPIGYDARQKVFQCPCHKQPRFDLSGKRTEGAASYSPRDMDTLEVEIRPKNNQKEVWIRFQTFAQGIAQKVSQG